MGDSIDGERQPLLKDDDNTTFYTATENNAGDFAAGK